MISKLQFQLLEPSLCACGLYIQSSLQKKKIQINVIKIKCWW